MPINPLFPRSQVGEFLAARPSRPPHPSSSPPALLSLLPPRDTHRSPKLANSLSTTEKLPLGIYRTPSVPDFLIGRSCKHTAPSASRPSPPPEILQSTHHPPILTVLLRSLELPLLPPSPATSRLLSHPPLQMSCGISVSSHHASFYFFVSFFPRRPRVRWQIGQGGSRNHLKKPNAHFLPPIQCSSFCRIRRSHCASLSRKESSMRPSKFVSPLSIDIRHCNALQNYGPNIRVARWTVVLWGRVTIAP